MHTLKLQYKRIDMERVFIAAGVTLMESAGLLLLICGILGIKPF